MTVPPLPPQSPQPHGGPQPQGGAQPPGGPQSWPSGWPAQHQNPPQQYPPQHSPAQPYPQQHYPGQHHPQQHNPQQAHPEQPYPEQPWPQQQWAQPGAPHQNAPQHNPPQPNVQPPVTPASPESQPVYGGGFQPSNYGGLGAFSPGAGKPKSKRPWVIGGAVAAVLVIGAGAAWLFGAFRGDTLDQKSLQDGVTRVLADNYGEPGVTNVSCPSGESTVNGTTFDCTLRIGGQPKKVTVRVLNDKPEYSVGAPH